MQLEMFRNFYQLSTDIFVVLDHDMVIHSANPAWENFIGYKPEELINQPVSRFMHPDDVKSTATEVAMLYGGRPINQFFNRYITRSGDVRWIRWRGAIFDGYTYGVGQDVTAEREAKRNLEDANMQLSAALKLERDWRAMAEVQQERFRGLFNQAPMIAAVYSGPEQKIELANPSFYQLVNFRNIMGSTVFEALPMLDETTVQTIKKVYATGKRFVGRNFVMSADWSATGSPSERVLHLIFEPIIDHEGRVESIWCLAFDVTETAELEVKLRSAERMSSLGEMAAGIGHEINNPLAYSLLNMDLLVEKLGFQFGSREAIPLPIADLMKKSIDGLDRVRDIVKGLKSFSRQDEASLEVLDVLGPLQAAVNFTSNETRHRAQLITDFATVSPIYANSGRLAQVFTNLLVNGAQAIELGKANVNRLTVRVLENDKKQVMIDFEDTGCGISADKIPRIFEPFYTTKPVGVGTGLGLSICHGIITSFGGEIQVSSEVGKGTRMRVILPATGKTTRQEILSAPSQVGESPRKRILVIDDDKALRDVILSALESDHDVHVLESAVEALNHLDNVREPYDWVICDVMMPAMTGMEFYETIRARGTGFEKKIILMTGGAFTPKVRSWMEELENPKLDKPFRVKQLKELLNKQS